MELTFLTPAGAIGAAAAVLPLTAFWLAGRRARRARVALGLDEPRRASFGPTALAIALVPGLLGLALAQPVIRTTQSHRVRQDAQAFYIFDTSESMRAAGGPGAPTRLDRALKAALHVRLALRDVPSGVATMTDRVLPHLFPTASGEVFEATLAESVGIDRPPPKGTSDRATTFAALDTLAGTNFFDTGIAHRLAFVFTDGETAPYFAADLREALSGPPRTSFVFVRFWRASERVFANGVLDPRYRPDPSSRQAMRTLAGLTEGRAFGEHDLAAAIRGARQLVGRGAEEEVGRELRVLALARWLVLAAALPLGFLFWRQDLLS